MNMNLKVVSIEKKKKNLAAYDTFLALVGAIVLSGIISYVDFQDKTFEKDKNNLLTYSDIQKIKKENIYGFSNSQLEVLGSLSLSLESGSLEKGFWVSDVFVTAGDVKNMEDTMIRRNLSDVKNFDRPLYDKLSAQLHKFNDSLLKRASINMSIFILALPVSLWLCAALIRGLNPIYSNNKSKADSDQETQG